MPSKLTIEGSEERDELINRLIRLVVPAHRIEDGKTIKQAVLELEQLIVEARLGELESLYEFAKTHNSVQTTTEAWQRLRNLKEIK